MARWTRIQQLRKRHGRELIACSLVCLSACLWACSDAGGSSPPEELDCSWTVDPAQYLNSSLMYEFFIDPRDSTQYPTVTLGNRQWFAQNLRYNLHPEREQCPYEVHLYSWNETVGADSASLSLDGENVQGICPDGWRVPANSDWKSLDSVIVPQNLAAGMDSVMAVYTARSLISNTTGYTLWDTSPDNLGNPYGFSVVPTFNPHTIVDTVLTATALWSATASAGKYAYTYGVSVEDYYLLYMHSYVYSSLVEGLERKSYQSVRCVRTLSGN